MNQELNQMIIKLVFGLLLALLTVAVKSFREFVKSKSGERGIAVMEIVARNAVNAVEQIYRNKDIHGVEKLVEAKYMALDALEKKGVKVTDEQLTLFLESAVKVMNDSFAAEKR